jgi:ornithine carbamoyltransferase
MKKLRHLLTTTDLSADEILRLFHLAEKLKEQTYHQKLKHVSLAMIFQKPSTRTRVSFEVAMTQLGGHALNLNSAELQLSRGETIADTARVLGRYVDGIMARVYSHQDIIDLAKYAGVPVINGLSDLYHPCQALADMFTLWERNKKLTGRIMAYVGDGDNNVTNSLMIIAAQLGINFRVASPVKYKIKDGVVNIAKNIAGNTGSRVEVLTDPKKAVSGADYVVTDVWVSMGREDRKERIKALQPYQLNSSLLKLAPKSYVLHCLPAHRGEEITDEVIDGPQSVVWDEAENRLHIQKAILLFLLDRN